jgi:hypothetical protein
MNINFNNVRMLACRYYDEMAELLQKAYNEFDSKGSFDEHDFFLDAETAMVNLRESIAAIACTYEEGNDKFRSVIAELYPEEGQSMAVFTTEPEEL